MTIAATASIDFTPYVLPVLGLPLIAAITLLFFGKRIHAATGRSGVAGYVTVGALGIAFGFAVAMFLQLLTLPAEVEGAAHGNARMGLVHLWDWMVVGNFSIGVDFLVDQLSVLMVMLVTGVGGLIALYSVGYMHGDDRYPRYFAYLALFAAFMLLLVLSDNLLLMFVGWEGVGLCSYLLIGFWYERPPAADAANKAFIVNRIGDFSFLLGVMLLIGTIGTVSVAAVNDGAASGAITGGIATIAALLLFGGAVGKSAQIPLYVWLPDAMEGPTPASALIHAATMVTAGVFMVARFGQVFVASSGDVALTVVAWTGALTALWAAFMAATQYDIKRVLAYSTVSQLGYMFLGNGLGAFSAGIFHLTTHAFFKALMFLGAGSVMHALANHTDMRKMGGLRKIMPITGLTFMMGWLAISGVPPFAGFFSKDAILAVAWGEGEYALWAIGSVTALLTAFYMSRLYFRVFEGPLVYPEDAHPHESPPNMTIPLIALAVLAVVGGALNLPGVLTLERYLEPALGHFDVPSGVTAWLLATGALIIAASGILIARYVYMTESGRDLRARLRSGSWLDRVISSARNRFYVDEGYNAAIVQPGKRLSMFSAYTIDAKVIDGTVNGVARLTAWTSDVTRRVQSGYVRNYAAGVLFGVVLIVAVLVARVGIS
ncbi:MAG: NADH-quinone oxidoreductase subunit L [Actinomycetota bacterium]